MKRPKQYSMEAAVETCRAYLLDPITLAAASKLYKELTKGAELDPLQLSVETIRPLEMSIAIPSISVSRNILRAVIVLGFEALHRTPAGKQFLANNGTNILDALFQNKVGMAELKRLFDVTKDERPIQRVEEAAAVLNMMQGSSKLRMREKAINTLLSEVESARENDASRRYRERPGMDVRGLG